MGTKAPEVSVVVGSPADSSPAGVTPFPAWFERLEINATNKGLRWSFFLAYLTGCAIVFLAGVAQELYTHDDFRKYTLPIGRGFGLLLNLNCALVLLPMVRGS